MEKTVPPVDAEALLQHGDFMRALAKSLLLDETRADDVVQQAWVAALERPPRDPSRLRAWLAAVVRNFARRSHRDDARRQRREGRATPPPDVPSADEILARENTRRAVVLAVLELAEPYRSTVVLRYLEELPPREVARRLEVPVETVRTRLKRALQRLRSRLDETQGGRRSWSLALVPLVAPKASGATAAATLGAILMSMKAKAALVIVACAVVIALWWWDDTRVEKERSGARVESAAAVPDAGAAGAATGAVESNESAAGTGAPDLSEAPPPGTTITGRVLADGRPLAGAYVYLQRDDRLAARWPATDASGRFHFDQSGTFTIGAAHAQRRPSSRKITAAPGEIVDLELDLPQSEVVAVTVVDGATGAPIEGAEILVLGSGEGTSNAALDGMLEAENGFPVLIRQYCVFDGLMEMFQAFSGKTRLHVPLLVTDARGRVEASGLTSRRLDVAVSHPAYAPARASASGDDDLVIKLFKGAGLTVIAPRFESGPAAGWTCEVDRFLLFPLPTAEARLDDDGRARFPALRPGDYMVTVSQHGTWDLSISTVEEADEDGRKSIRRAVTVNRASGGVSLRRRITLDEGEARVLDLSAIRGATIAGRIVPHAEKEPVWMVRLEKDDDEIGRTGADPEGRFRFEKVPPGTYRVVADKFHGGGARVERDVQVDRAEGTILVTLDASGLAEITGLVTGPDGKPLAGATVLAFRGELPRDPRGLNAIIAVLSSQEESDGEGRYRLEGLPAGEYRLFCTHEGSLVRERFRLEDGEGRRSDLRLDTSRTHRVTLRTVADGKLHAAFVLVRGEEEGQLLAILLAADDISAEAKPREEFTYRLPAGRYFIDAYADDMAPRRNHPLEVDGVMEETVPLQRGQPVTLRLERDEGPLARAEVEVRDAHGLRVPKGTRPFEVLIAGSPWRTDDGGELVLPRLLPGRYTVHAGGKQIGEFRHSETPLAKTIRLPRE